MVFVFYEDILKEFWVIQVVEFCSKKRKNLTFKNGSKKNIRKLRFTKHFKPSVKVTPLKNNNNNKQQQLTSKQP